MRTLAEMRNPKNRATPKFVGLPFETLVIVDSCASGNLAHEPNDTPETVRQVVERRGLATYSGTSTIRTARIVDVPAFEATHSVKLMYPDDPRHLELRGNRIVVQIQ